MFETAVVAHEPAAGFDDELEFGVGVVRDMAGKYGDWYWFDCTDDDKTPE